MTRSLKPTPIPIGNTDPQHGRGGWLVTAGGRTYLEWVAEPSFPYEKVRDLFALEVPDDVFSPRFLNNFSMLPSLVWLLRAVATEGSTILPLVQRIRRLRLHGRDPDPRLRALALVAVLNRYGWAYGQHETPFVKDVRARWAPYEAAASRRAIKPKPMIR